MFGGPRQNQTTDTRIPIRAIRSSLGAGAPMEIRYRRFGHYLILLCGAGADAHAADDLAIDRNG